jgi:hypothetical protein
MFGDRNQPLVYRIGDTAPIILRQVLDELGKSNSHRMGAICRE